MPRTIVLPSPFVASKPCMVRLEPPPSGQDGSGNRPGDQWAVAIGGASVYLALKMAIGGASLIMTALTAAAITFVDSLHAMGVVTPGGGVADTSFGPNPI